VAFLGACTREPPACETPNPEPLTVQLDLLRRQEEEGGVLAGEALLTVPAPTVLGALTLELVEERLRRGLFGVRTRSRTLRRVHLLGAAPVSGWRSLLGAGSGMGIYAPGHYGIPFRLPLGDVLPTVDLPGATEQRRLQLRLRLERRGGAFDAGIEVVIVPLGSDGSRSQSLATHQGGDPLLATG
jgi:hypothetical protein